MTFQNELKPPLEEALEHYGVKGMKWGVRRDQRTLDRAAGRTPRTKGGKAKQAIREIGGTPSSGMGKRAAWNPVASSREIKAARKEMRKLSDKIMTAEDRRDQAKTPAERKKAQKALNKLESEWDRTHHKAVAVQMTVGQAAAVAILSTALTTPVGGAAITFGSMTASQANSQRIANKRANLLEKEFMKGKTYAEVEKESIKVLKKAANK